MIQFNIIEILFIYIINKSNIVMLEIIKDNKVEKGELGKERRKIVYIFVIIFLSCVGFLSITEIQKCINVRVREEEKEKGFYIWKYFDNF